MSDDSDDDLKGFEEDRSRNPSSPMIVEITESKRNRSRSPLQRDDKDENDSDDETMSRKKGKKKNMNQKSDAKDPALGKKSMESSPDYTPTPTVPISTQAMETESTNTASLPTPNTITPSSTSALTNTEIINTGTQNTLTTPTPHCSYQTQTDSGSSEIKDQNKKKTEWIRNKTFTTLFIEPNETKNTNKNGDREGISIHPMEIAKTLQKVGIKQYKELKRAGRARYKITFEKPQHAEALLNSRLLKEEFNYNVFIPKMFQETIGVIKSVPPSITEEEIRENIECGNKKITKIERIKKMFNGVLKDTYSVKLYFEGEKLPTEVRIFGIASKVDVYVFPVKLCYRCWRYGHKTNSCKRKLQSCADCGFEHKVGECVFEGSPRCLHCQGPHKANDRNCPERIRQKNIQEAMAKQKLTFPEASKLFPTKTQSVQDRIQQNDFPILQNTTSHIAQEQQLINQIPSTSYSNVTNGTTKETQNQSMEKVVGNLINHYKQEIIKQLNLHSLVETLKAISINLTNPDKERTNHETTENLNLQICKILETLNPEVRDNMGPAPKPPASNIQQKS